MSDENKDYLQELQELRDSLKVLLKREFLEELVALAEMIDKSYVDSYCRIVENSEFGKNCGYAAKAKDLFMKLSERPVSAKIKYIYETFLAER